MFGSIWMFRTSPSPLSIMRKVPWKILSIRMMFQERGNKSFMIITNLLHHLHHRLTFLIDHFTATTTITTHSWITPSLSSHFSLFLAGSLSTFTSWSRTWTTTRSPWCPTPPSRPTLTSTSTRPPGRPPLPIHPPPSASMEPTLSSSTRMEQYLTSPFSRSRRALVTAGHS